MKKIYYLIATIVLISILYMSVVSAAPVIETLAINNETKECQLFPGGDECSRCELPEGWVGIGTSFDECPEGYSKPESYVSAICESLKEPFCCSMLHSGSRGDCEDLIVNAKEKKCAFVENITECENLPEGWKRAEDESRGRLCPWVECEFAENKTECGYEWIGGEDTPYVTDNLIDCNQPEEETQQTNFTNIFIGILILIILFFVIIYFIKKRK